MTQHVVPHPVTTARAIDAATPTSFRRWGQRFRARLHDRRFWLIQAMVVAVSGAHAGSELLDVADSTHLAAIYFVPASLYFFPILYASLNFGREGAIPTALWSAALATPNALLWHHGFERLGEAIQLTLMIFLACIVAWRVDKEVAARLRAEATERARALSEVKYRALFDGAAEPVIVLGDDGRVEDANAAAVALLGHSPASLLGRPLVEILGLPELDLVAAAVGSPMDERTEIRVRRPDGGDTWLQPLFTVIPGVGRETLAQVMLRDVTERRGFQQYAREITRAQEEERQRIAQELHDVSVQSAIMICRRLDAAAEAVDEGSPHEITTSLAEARRTAETMADELRRFSRDLRPLILDDLGLVPALNRLVMELRVRSDVDARFEASGSLRRLEPAVELAMFRICQEALRNVELHADAFRASVRIDFGRDTVTLSVADEGEGFIVPDMAGLVTAGRLGLLGMRERAHLVGGTCEIQSSPGAGTAILARIPATAPARDSSP